MLLPFAVRADAPGVPEDAQMEHAQWQHRSRGSSKGKGLCFRSVHVQKLHLLFGNFFSLLRKGVREMEPALTEIQLKPPSCYLHLVLIRRSCNHQPFNRHIRMLNVSAGAGPWALSLLKAGPWEWCLSIELCQLNWCLFPPNFGSPPPAELMSTHARVL